MSNTERQKLNKELFLARMRELWVGHGNTETENIDRAWAKIHECYETQLSGKTGLHVSDSVCGTGKTLSVVAACSVLAQTNTSIGGLIVVRFTDEADNIAKRINDIVGEKVAVAFHSRLTKEEKTQLDVSKYQFVIITHVSYIASVSSDHNNKDRFRNWVWGERDFRVIDESLDLVERHSITMGDLREFGHIITCYKERFALKREFSDQFLLVDLIEEFLHTRSDDGYVGQLYEQVISKFDTEVYLSSMIETIIQADTDAWWMDDSYSRGKDSHELKSKFVELATLFDRVIRLETWLSDNKRGMKASAGELVLPDQFDSLCILDATSNIDMIYNLFSGSSDRFNRYSVPRNVRNFSNATLHVLPTGSGLGKLSGKQAAAMRQPKLVQWAVETFNSSDKVLFAGHKEQMTSLKSLLEKANVRFQYDLIWWGAIDGKNTWKTYNKLVVTSLLFLPPDHSPTAKLAFKALVPELEVDGDDSIASSAMAVSLIQLLCRIRIRNVTDFYGNCDTSDIYLPLEAHKASATTDFRNLLTRRGAYLLNSIEDSLNKINVRQWDDFTFSTKKVTKKADSVMDSFINWINCLQPGDTYYLKDFLTLIPEKQVGTIKNHLKRPSSIPSKHIAAMGVVREAVKRKGTKFYFAS